MAEQQVARFMAQRPGNGAETVDINEHQRNAALAALHILDHRLPDIMEIAAIGQPGQRIDLLEIGGADRRCGKAPVDKDGSNGRRGQQKFRGKDQAQLDQGDRHGEQRDANRHRRAHKARGSRDIGNRMARPGHGIAVACQECTRG